MTYRDSLIIMMGIVIGISIAHVCWMDKTSKDVDRITQAILMAEGE